jgi:DNA-binding winged helix-turn-helix (wHTH) protein
MDVARYRLLRGQREIPLRPKSWDVLRFLLEQAGLLVTKEALHREVWADTAVSDDALTKSISELRRALGDTRRTPRFIETVHGRGFRFMAEVREIGDERGDSSGTRFAAVEDSGGEPGVHFVGRQAELRRLQECLRRAGQGERQLVFVTGEAGIGKTTLAEEFLRSPAARGPDVHVLRGQCVQQRGQREPYMPVLEALERILGSPAGPPLIPLFRRMAPCWYAQIPWLLSAAEPLSLPSAMMTAPPERMLREITAFLEALAARATIILVLEDLHWSDSASADLVAFLAERRDPARLLILATFRPAEAATEDHPIREIKQTLRAHRRCLDLALDYLSPANVRDYLRRRFGDGILDLAPLIHRRTDGNPLFVVAVLEELIQRGQLVSTDPGWTLQVAVDGLDLAVPEDLLEMVGAQFTRLGPDERGVLEAASVAGLSFVPSTVARALGRDPEEVEGVAQRLARTFVFLNAVSGEGAGSPARRYDFTHALHHQAIYEQIPELRRQRLHLTIAEMLESTSGERVADIAPELSVHFERGGDLRRAAKYLAICAARAQQQQAPHEVIRCAELALTFLAREPHTPERDQRELELRLLLGVSLHLTRGYSAPSVRANYEHTRRLCEAVGDASQMFEVLHVAWYAQMVSSKLDAAQETADELARLAEIRGTPEFHLRATLARGRVQFWTGHFGTADRLCSEALRVPSGQAVEVHAEAYGVDPMVGACGIGSMALWCLGHPEQARARAAHGIAYAEKSGRPHSVASACIHAVMLELFRRDGDVAARLAARTERICADQPAANFGPMARVFAGAALAEQGDPERGLSTMVSALADHRDVVGTHITDIMLGLMGAACARAGRWTEGLRWVDEGIALSEASHERVYIAELWRVKGELLLGQAATGKGKKRSPDSARRCFHRALEISEAQEARSFALRTAISLARLARRHGGAVGARARLRSLYDSFTEGFDTKDLQEAKALLDEPVK